MSFLFLQQKAKFILNFLPHFEFSPEVAESGKILNRAFCDRFSDSLLPLADYFNQSVNNVNICHSGFLDFLSAPQHFHALRDLLMREFGSLAVFALVSFFFMPVIRAQKLALRGPPSGCGAFNPGFPGFALL
jgi:hypothetical protein